jgi:uncharacterized membrane protein
MALEFGRPWFLLLLLLVPLMALWFRRARGGPLPWADRLALALRTVLVAALACALADLRFVQARKGRATALVQDISESIPDEARAAAAKSVERWLLDRDPEHEDVSYLVFAGGTGIETPFRGLGGLRPEDLRPLDPARVGSVLDRGATDVEAALRAAQASFPPESAARLVLLTDGNENRGEAAEAIRALAEAGVEVLVQPIRYDRPAEVLVEKVVAPPRARAGQPVSVRAVILSTEDGRPATLRFSDDQGRTLATREVTLRAGRNPFELRREFTAQGLHVTRVSVESPGDGDPVNNHGTAAVVAEGSPAVLVAARSEAEAEPLRRALVANDFFVNLVGLGDLPAGPGGLLPYECVVLVDASAADLGPARMRVLQAAVEETGIGLLAVGGPQSFSAGAWGGTPLEEVLPVTMDVSQKRVLPNGAVVVVLHTCEFAQGNDWARSISKAVVRSLGRKDWFGCVDFQGSFQAGTGAHWVVPLAQVDPGPMVAALDRANPNDMPSLHDCVASAVDALEKAPAYLKHLIVVSDGDPAMPSDAVVQRMVDLGITISAVAIAQHGVQDAMRPMTAATGGRYYDLPEGAVDTLPAIFMKEASVVRRSTVFEEPFVPAVSAIHESMKGVKPEEIPALGGYVVSSIKDRAELVLADPENGDPILAFWRKGLGVAAAFTSDFTGRWGAGWVAWDRYDKVVTQIVRACGRSLQRSAFGVSVEAAAGKGLAVVEAVDAAGNYVDGLAFEGTVVAPSGERTPLAVRQTAPGRYEAAFDASEPGIHLVSLLHDAPAEEAGGGPRKLQIRAACPVDYSPEHLALRSDASFFDRAAAAGARILGPGARPFLDPLPETRTQADAWRWALLAAVLLFPFEVAARRLRLDPGPLVARLAARLRGIRPRLPRRAAAPSGPPVIVTGATAVAGRAGEEARAAAEAAARSGPAGAAGPAPAPGSPAPPAAAPDPASDALLRAKKRARKQTRWEDNG